MAKAVRVVRQGDAELNVIGQINESFFAESGFDVNQIRAEFPILSTQVNGKPLVYLDNGASSQKPVAVIEAMDAYWRETNANVHRGVHYLSQKATREFDASREKVRAFLGAKHSHEIIFTAGCTASINLVAESWGRSNLKAGDEILISTMEHHSNTVPWQLIAQRVGATVLPIPISDAGEIDLDAYRGMLSERTKMVAIIHVSNSLGTINPVKEIIQMAHAAGAKVLVDGAQAGPHIRINVQDLNADFYTLSCHKMYAPTGIGVLYGKETLLNEMPPYQGGGDMIHTVSFEKTTYAPLPYKFEAGTPNIAGVIGLGSTIDYLAALGSRFENREVADISEALDAAFRTLEAREKELTDYGMQVLGDIDGVRLTGTAPNKVGILAFTLDCAHPHDVGTVLDNIGIAVRTGHHCCMPLMKRLGVPATTRASLAMYNTHEEIDELVVGIKKVKELFG